MIPFKFIFFGLGMVVMADALISIKEHPNQGKTWQVLRLFRLGTAFIIMGMATQLPDWGLN